MAESSERFWKWLGLVNLSVTRLYRGEGAVSLSLLEQAAQAYPDSEALCSSARATAAHVLLESGRPKEAFEQARLAAITEATLPHQEALFYLGLANARLGESNDAERTAEELLRRSGAAGLSSEMARFHLLKGELALAGGRHSEAREDFQRAEAALPAVTTETPSQSLQVPVWYSRASCDLEAGDFGAAADGFERIVTSFSLHIDWPILYVRSFYLLGQIREKQSDDEGARTNYRRFVEFWKEGDLDRRWVQEAESKG
jgi:TolA-binding protein